MLAVGRDSTGTQVQIAYAVAGSTLEPGDGDPGLSLFGAGPLRGHRPLRQGRRRRSTPPATSWRRPRCPTASTWSAGSSVPVPPGRFDYRLAIQQGEEAGVLLPRDTVRVGQPTSTALALSDLVLGSRNTNLFWRRTAEDTVVFNPLRTFKRKENMELYYEVEGLSAGHRVHGARSRCGSRAAAAGSSGRSSAAAPPRSASSSRRARRSRSPAPAEPQARQAQAGQLHAGGDGGGRPGADGSADAAVSGGEG